VDQLFLLARNLGQEGAAAWAGFAGAALVAQGQRILRDGKPLDDDAQAEALHKQARSFEAERLAVLRAFGVAT